jgi:glc operon protein GlcG
VARGFLCGIASATALSAILAVPPAYAQAPAPQPPGPAQAAPPPEYGLPIGAADAKKAAAAAIAENGRIGANPMAIAIVDPAGRLVYFERMDNTQYGSVRVAIDKARSAALFRRPTKVFEEAVASGRNGILALRGAMPSEGGVPIVTAGKIIGAIGASGGTSAQDGQAAGAGAKAVGQ